ncbi:MAG: pilus assembly protein TadB [Planctomyces sp.]|nr:pilus assembly protein TadB [Planctomyces sp.]
MASSTVTPPSRAADFSGILRPREEFAQPGAEGASQRLNQWFDRLMLQSGLGISPGIVLMLCLLGGLTVGGLVFVIQENFLTTALAACVGFMLPVFMLMFIRSRRQNQMLGQLPAMLEELARAATTGRSIEQCLQLIAADTPSPLGDELQLSVKRMQMGMPLREAMADLPDRTGLMTLRLFCMTLGVHQQTGGDLVWVLEQLSRTIRDRLQYLGRLRAMTAASRATALLMVLLPPGVLVFFTLRDPDYFSKLIGSPWGRNATLLAFALTTIGTIWVLRILKDSQRT